LNLAKKFELFICTHTFYIYKIKFNHRIVYHFKRELHAVVSLPLPLKYILKSNATRWSIR